MTDPISTPNVEAPRPRSRIVGLSLRIGITSIALGWTFSKLELGDLASSMLRIAPLAALLALALNFANLSAGALRWQVLLAAYGAERKPPFSRLAQLYLIGMFYNTFLPANVGGDVLRGYVTRDAFSGSAGAYLIVAIERVFGLAGLLALAAAVLWARPIARFDWLPYVALAGLAGAILAALSPLLARRIAPRLPSRLGAIAAALPLVHFPSLLWVVMLLSVITQTIVAFTGHTLVHAIDPSITLASSLIFVPLSMVATYLPTVAGLGAREAAYVLLFGTVGMSGADATAASLAYFGVQLIVALIGGLVHLIAPTR